MDDYSTVTVKIEENVAIKSEVVDPDDSDSNIPLSDLIPDERGNVVEFFEGETQFIKPEPIEGGPSGSSNIGDSGSCVGSVKSFVCPECDRAFSLKCNLKTHISAVHMKLKKFVCGECDSSFSQKGNLNKHVTAVHLKLKKFVCGECDHAFTQQGDLKRHIDSVHRKLKKFTCGECQSCFHRQGI